jgi:PST family polysaccharide transporter
MGGMAMTFLRNGGVAVIQFVVMILISRFLTKEQMGYATATIFVANLSTLVSQMGIAPAIVQLRKLDSRHVATGFLASMASGLFQTAVVLLFAPIFALLFKMPEVVPLFRAISFVFVLNAVSRIATMVLTRDLEFGKLTKAELWSNLAYGVVTVALAVLHFQAWSVAYGLIVQSLVLTVLIMVKCPLPRSMRFDREAFRELMTVARGFSLSAILNFVANQADQVVVGRYLGAASLGVYSRAYALMARPASLLAMSVNRVLFPTMARAQDDEKELVSLFGKTTTAIALLVLPTGFVFAVLAPEIVHTLLGHKWNEVIVPFQILAAGMILRIGNQSSDALVRAIGNAAGRVGPNAAFAACVVVFTYVGSKYGLSGVACGVLLANLVQNVLIAHVALRRLPIGWFEFAKAHQAPILVAIAASVSAWAVAEGLRTVGAPDALVLITGLAVSAAVGLGVVALGTRKILGSDAVLIRDTIGAKLRKRGRKLASASSR